VPRGYVLRCHIEDDEAGQDDQELSLHEFGMLLKRGRRIPQMND
jgi:hypothetical protein